jgi:hypothetical protein
MRCRKALGRRMEEAPDRSQDSRVVEFRMMNLPISEKDIFCHHPHFLILTSIT